MICCTFGYPFVAISDSHSVYSVYVALHHSDIMSLFWYGIVLEVAEGFHCILYSCFKKIMRLSFCCNMHIAPKTMLQLLI